MQVAEIIKLDDSLLVGTGTNRACYVHPSNNNQCIKITISGNNKESVREIKYYRYLQKKKISWDMLAQFYGVVKTNKGEGEVLELIRDYNENISSKLSDCIASKSFTKDRLIQLLNGLKRYLEDEKIVVKDLNTVNILYQKFSETTGRLVIMDGINNREWIPKIDYFVNKKIFKIWEEFIVTVKFDLIG